MKPIGLSIAEAGNALGGLSRATIYRMIARHELVALKVGSRTLVTLKSIEALVASAPRLHPEDNSAPAGLPPVAQRRGSLEARLRRLEAAERNRCYVHPEDDAPIVRGVSYSLPPNLPKAIV